MMRIPMPSVPMILLAIALTNGSAQTTFEPSSNGPEIYPTLKIRDKVLTNVRVVEATPLKLTLLFDGGGTTVPLQDLPDELKKKYPFDAAKAAEYNKRGATEESSRLQTAQSQQVQQVSAKKAYFLRREQ